MRISDWSSDVCSSDLLGLGQAPISTPYFERTFARHEFVHHRCGNIFLTCLPAFLGLARCIAIFAVLDDLETPSILILRQRGHSIHAAFVDLNCHGLTLSAAHHETGNT